MTPWKRIALTPSLDLRECPPENDLDQEEEEGANVGRERPSGSSDDAGEAPARRRRRRRRRRSPSADREETVEQDVVEEPSDFDAEETPRELGLEDVDVEAEVDEDETDQGSAPRTAAPLASPSPSVAPRTGAGGGERRA